MSRRRIEFSDEEKNKIITSYIEGLKPVKVIQKENNISSGTMYRLLAESNIPLKMGSFKKKPYVVARKYTASANYICPECGETIKTESEFNFCYICGTPIVTPQKCADKLLELMCSLEQNGFKDDDKEIFWLEKAINYLEEGEKKQ